MIKVLYVGVGEDPVVREVNPTLDDFQALVGGGYIQMVPYEGVDLVLDEEGKLKGLPPNRPLWGGMDMAHGAFFFVRHDEEGEAASLLDDDIRRLKREFTRV